MAEWADKAEGESRSRATDLLREVRLPGFGFTIAEIEPRLFSFNNPAGRLPGLRWSRHETGLRRRPGRAGQGQSLHKGAVSPWAKGPSPLYTQTLQALARHYGFLDG